MTARLALAIFLAMGAAASAVALAACSAWLIARAAEMPPVLYLLVAVTAVRAFAIARAVLRYAERLAAHDAVFRMLADVRGAIYARLVQLAPAGLAESRSGDLLARLVGDVDALSDRWLRVRIPTVTALAVSGVTVALMCWFAPPVGVVVAVALAIAALVGPRLAATVARRSAESLAAQRGVLSASIVEAVNGAAEIRVSGSGAAVSALLAAQDADMAEQERRHIWGVGAGGFVSGLATSAAVWAALVVGATAMASGAFSGVALTVLTLTPLALTEIVASLVPAAERRPALEAADARLAQVLARPHPVLEPTRPASMPGGALGLRVVDVRLRYPQASATIGPLSFVVSAGERVIVTGESGSGKSTLVAALARFIDPVSGSIALVGDEDEAALVDLAGDDVRSNVSICLQDEHVFDGTIAQNLRIARPDATDAELDEALDWAGLLDEVTAMPDGKATTVGEHGAWLSGGQRQRVALARLFLHRGRLLILDEPTEHLDDVHARAVIDRLSAEADGRTIVVMTHRPELFDGWRHAADLEVHAAHPSMPGARAVLA